MRNIFKIMTDHTELAAYKHLCSLVSNNEHLQKIHYGTSLKELEATSSRIEKGSDEEYPCIASSFVKENRPVLFYYIYPKVINSNKNNNKKLGRENIADNEIALEFDLNDKSHLINGFTLNNIIPSAVAEKGYRIRWPHNIGSHIYRYGLFTHNKRTIHEFDDITSDILLTYPQRGEDLDSVNVDIGNISELQTFSSILPQKNTIFVPSFPFCSNDITDGFPLHKCTYHDEITVSLILRSDLQSLLIVAREVENTEGDVTLELVKPEPDVRYATFYEGGKPVTSFSHPLAVGYFSFLSPNECGDNSCKDSQTNNSVAFFVNQAFSYSVKNSTPLSQTACIEKVTQSHVVTSLAWLAYQRKSIENHIYSNYTTNPSSDFSTGISPISETTISNSSENGIVTYLEKMPGIVTTNMASRFYTRKIPTIPGIHFHTFGVRANDNTNKPGFYFKDGSLDFVIQENDPLVKNGQRAKNNDEYKIEARIFCRIPFYFETFVDTEEKRRSGKTILKPLETLAKKSE